MIDLQFIIQVCTLIGVLVGVVLFISKPQQRSETADAVFDERLKNVEKHVTNHIMHKLDQNDEEHKKIMDCQVRMETKLDILIEKRR